MMLKLLIKWNQTKDDNHQIQHRRTKACPLTTKRILFLIFLDAAKEGSLDKGKEFIESYRSSSSPQYIRVGCGGYLNYPKVNHNDTHNEFRTASKNIDP